MVRYRRGAGVRLLRGMAAAGVAAALALGGTAAGASSLEAQGDREVPAFRSLAVSKQLEPAHGGKVGIRSSDLVWAGVFVGGLLLVEPAERIEEAIARAVGDGRVGGAALASMGEVAGHGFAAYGLAGGTFLTGTLIGEPAVARVGLRSLESLVIATGTTAFLKLALGRERPLWSPHDSDDFRPFDNSLGRSSFPSGHTAHLFALAGTVSHELGEDAAWIPYVAYPVAGLVGASRVVGQKHWVTDVVSGAALGMLSSRLVGRLHAEDGSRHAAPAGERLVTVGPLLLPEKGGGIVLGVTIQH